MRAVSAVAIATLMLCGPVLGSAFTAKSPRQHFAQTPSQQEPIATKSPLRQSDGRKSAHHPRDRAEGLEGKPGNRYRKTARSATSCRPA